MFVLVHATWCGHCKSLMPVWNKITKQYKKTNPEAEFLTIDTDTKNETDRKILEKLQIKGFPTIVSVSTDKIVTYEGDRSEADLKKFFDKYC